jgi:predicted amidohydrolase
MSIRNAGVAAIQMVSGPEVEQNIDSARRLIREAASGGASLVLLPEYWPILGLHETDKLTQAEAIGNGPIQRFMSQLSRELGIWLIGGTLPLVSPVNGKVLNTLLVYDPAGDAVARYDKIHLFGFTRGTESYDESRTIAAGIDLGDCTLMVVPSAFTYTTGKAHWEILLRARAIENQCYVLAAAQGGRHANGRQTWGHSMLIDPWGDVLAVLPEGEGVVSGEIEADRLASVRESLPALRHRRL